MNIMYALAAAATLLFPVAAILFWNGYRQDERRRGQPLRFGRRTDDRRFS